MQTCLQTLYTTTEMDRVSRAGNSTHWIRINLATSRVFYVATI